jgi:hypothetical protein
MTRRSADFTTIRSEGGLLPPDLLRRVLDPKEKLPGIRPEDYGLPQGERLNEIITPSWNRLRKHWAEFRAAASALPAGESGTGITNDKWSLPLLRELGFGLLPTSAGPEINGRTYAINRFFGSTPIHLVGCNLSLDRRASGVRGAAAASPHGLLQDFLNRSSGHVWGIASNGLCFRILRDNQALSRQSFLDFDLESMFDGEVYSDFVLLWLIAHATRFAPREADRSESCWLEQWTKQADEQGTRALGDLRIGVERALQILGEGFTSHPKNTSLRDSLRTGQTSLADFHGQLLRVVYRLIFLSVAEDRPIDGQPLLHPRDDSEPARRAREHYASYYGTARLRELAGKIKGSRHGDLWRQFQLVVGALSGEAAFDAVRKQLALPVLGSLLWNPKSTAALNSAELTNYDLLEALRNLAFTHQGKVLRPVDYKNLGAEELGGVYESLLALTPQISADGAHFNFTEFAGNERKTSGSYYTPDSLVQCLLDSALDPVVEQAIKDKSGTEAEKAILALRVCDTAVGSGHFLVGAAHRLARHLARVRALAQGESEPSPLLYQHALREVIGHCLYGVDINPMAAELCRVSLWLEALEPGKPLSFLDHHIRVGNSLLGATPELIAGGLPDAAFEPIEGDDREACSSLKRLNRVQREALRDLFIAEDKKIRERLRQYATELDEMDDSQPETLKRKEAAFRSAESTDDLYKARTLANLWCGAFVIRKRFAQNTVVTVAATISAPESAPPVSVPLQAGLFGVAEEAPKAKTKKTRRRIQSNSAIPVGITTQHLRDFVENGALPEGLLEEVQRLATSYGFFHWHLSFPEVFARGGFDCVLGNPPWEKFTISDEEWYAGLDENVAGTNGKAERDRKIKALAETNPSLYATYKAAKRDEAIFTNVLTRDAGTYPFTGFKELNTYHLFTELAAKFVNPGGRVALIVKTGIGSAENCLPLFKELTDKKRLVSLFDFVNRKPLFPDVQTVERFSLITFTGAMGTDQPIRFATLCVDVANLKEPGRQYTLSAEDIALMSPINGACPLMRSEQDAKILRKLYKHFPILGQKDASRPDLYWNPNYTPIFHMANDSGDFRKREELEAQGYELRSGIFVSAEVPRELRRWHEVAKWEGDEEVYLPLYEGKYIYLFDHLYGTFESVPASKRFGRKAEAPAPTLDQLADPEYEIVPRYWFSRHLWRKRQRQRMLRDDVAFYFRDVAGVYPDLRTAIGSICQATPAGDKAPCLTLATAENDTQSWALRLLTFGGLFNSLVFDYIVRNKLFSKSMKWNTLGQIVMPPPSHCIRKVFDGSLQGELAAAALELSFTSWSLAPLGEAFGIHQPFRYDSARRFDLLRHIDAISAHLYGLRRDELEHILSTFETLAAAEMKKHNEYRTKRVILEIYDAMQKSISTGEPYQTLLDPPPADPRCCHKTEKEPQGAAAKEISKASGR